MTAIERDARLGRRRLLLALAAALASAGIVAPAAPAGAGTPTAEPAYSYPIGVPGRPLGDGFFIRDGYACENTWYNPGYWHTGEDWYAVAGDSAGAHVYAVAAGEVVYADSDYPGRVVIVRDTDGLYAMYGHLDPALRVRVGGRVARGDPIGRVFKRTDAVPSHLHFELRTFLTTPAVNGEAPRYGFACGVNCPPGPGYWPIAAPEHPGALGWRNPTHVIARRGFTRAAAGAAGVPAVVVVADGPASATAVVWSAPSGDQASRRIDEMALKPGGRFPLLDVRAGPEDSRGTSADAHSLWYRIRLLDGRDGWVQAAIPSKRDTGSDGRPSSVRFDFYPAIVAEA